LALVELELDTSGAGELDLSPSTRWFLEEWHTVVERIDSAPGASEWPDDIRSGGEHVKDSFIDERILRGRSLYRLRLLEIDPEILCDSPSISIRFNTVCHSPKTTGVLGDKSSSPAPDRVQNLTYQREPTVAGDQVLRVALKEMQPAVTAAAARSPRSNHGTPCCSAYRASGSSLHRNGPQQPSPAAVKSPHHCRPDGNRAGATSPATTENRR